MSQLAIDVNNAVSHTKPQCSITANNPDVLTNIYEDDINITIWQRELSNKLTTAVGDFLDRHSTVSAVLSVTPQTTPEVLCDTFGESNISSVLSKDIALLVDMFCCLFDLKRAGLRLTALETAMCPRFHVDHIPCRLVSTYQGIATHWLHNSDVDRTKLGVGHQGKTDEKSGLFTDLSDVNRLTEGDVALLKGENWNDNEGFGLVHRSPPMLAGERRLLLTLDFIND